VPLRAVACIAAGLLLVPGGAPAGGLQAQPVEPTPAQPVPTAAGDPVPSDFADLVRTLVAGRWGVGAEAVHLSWGEPLVEPADNPVEVRLGGTGAGGNWTVEVVGSESRTLHRVRAGTWVRVAVAARELPRGARLGAADVEIARTPRWGPPAADANPEAGPRVADREGWEVLSPLRAGDELASPRVRPPEVVRSGDRVTLQVRRGPVRAEARGEARGSGGVGDVVRVRLASGRIVTGVIRSPGVVDVTDNEPSRTGS
jgi:flagella basal body P-ring formation protein FlgA